VAIHDFRSSFATLFDRSMGSSAGAWLPENWRGFGYPKDNAGKQMRVRHARRFTSFDMEVYSAFENGRHYLHTAHISVAART
jgi:hypothetical protein